jgi:TonB family protein
VAIRDYVPLAKMARVSGIVEVKCTLDDNGSVRQAEVISGHPLLKEQARRNAMLWQFQRTSPEVKTNSVTLFYEYLLEGTLQEHDNTVFVVEPPNRIQIIAPPAYFTP